MKTLEKIQAKYSQITHNSGNYHIGGGLADGSFASNRHQDAKFDQGKLTLGKATQLFKEATGLDIDSVREVLEYAVPNMEWHHAGKLPKQYGGGMKKTYFLNASEIAKIAGQWDLYVEKLALSKAESQKQRETEKDLKTRQLEFLKANAKQVTRVSKRPTYFIETDREMYGKYGWFSSYGKSYNMPEYYSGWEFENAETWEKYIQIR